MANLEKMKRINSKNTLKVQKSQKSQTKNNKVPIVEKKHLLLRLKESLESLVRPSIIFLIFILISATFFSLGSLTEKDTCDTLHHDWLQRVPNKIKQIADRIQPENVIVLNDRVIIKGKFDWAGYENTDSMLPLLDFGSNGLYYYVNENTTLYLGDVIAFRIPNSNNTIIHRIVQKGTDQKGEYFRTRGDNLIGLDPYVIRRGDIKRVLVGVLW